MKTAFYVLIILSTYAFAGWLDNQAQAEDQAVQYQVSCDTDSDCGCTDDCLDSDQGE